MQRLLMGGYLLTIAVFGIVAARELPLVQSAYAQIGSCGEGSGVECRIVTRCLRWHPTGFSIAKFSLTLGVTCAEEEQVIYRRITAEDIRNYCPLCSTPETGGPKVKPRVRCNQGWCKGGAPPLGG